MIAEMERYDGPDGASVRATLTRVGDLPRHFHREA